MNISTAILTVLAVVLTARAPAAVHYSGVRVFPISYDLEGGYLNPVSGQYVSSWPSSWGTSPWINPVFGGAAIGSSDKLRPVISAPDTGNGDGQVVNMVAGMMIGSGSQFASGGNGSETHTGTDSGKFQPGVPGYIGFAMEPAPGQPLCYGWIHLTVNNAGTGTIHEWAWEDSGAMIAVGFTGIPEPGSAFCMLGAIAAAFLRRRRH